jgi:hypothetical protein
VGDEAMGCDSFDENTSSIFLGSLRWQETNISVKSVLLDIRFFQIQIRDDFSSNSDLWKELSCLSRARAHAFRCREKDRRCRNVNRSMCFNRAMEQEEEQYIKFCCPLIFFMNLSVHRIG